MNKDVILRALKVALLVGTVLAVINHYDMFISGHFEMARMGKIVITYFVPFLVSIHGGVSSKNHERRNGV